MPMMDHDDEDIQKIYEISDIIHQEGRVQVKATVIGDFNTNMEEASTNKVVGLFGLCRRN
jgi:hypothetical protein